MVKKDSLKKKLEEKTDATDAVIKNMQILDLQVEKEALPRDLRFTPCHFLWISSEN